MSLPSGAFDDQASLASIFGRRAIHIEVPRWRGETAVCDSDSSLGQEVYQSLGFDGLLSLEDEIIL